MRLWLTFMLAGACHGQDQPFRPATPKVWDEQALRELELPLAHAKATPRYPSADYYYSIPELTVYKSYSSSPREGMNEDEYLAWLRQQEPEVAFDAAQLRTKGDWIKAGERVFYAPNGFHDQWGPRGSFSAAAVVCQRERGAGKGQRLRQLSCADCQ